MSNVAHLLRLRFIKCKHICWHIILKTLFEILDNPMYTDSLKTSQTYKKHFFKNNNNLEIYLKHGWCHVSRPHKMPAMHFPCLFSLAFPPSIAPSHRSMTELGRCVLHQMSDCISLLLAKQGIWKGQSCHPTSLSMVLRRKSFSLLDLSVKIKIIRQVDYSCYFTCCFCILLIRKQLKQEQLWGSYVCVCVS